MCPKIPRALGSLERGGIGKAKKDLIDKIAEKELKTELYERPNTNINPGA